MDDGAYVSGLRRDENNVPRGVLVFINDKGEMTDIAYDKLFGTSIMSMCKSADGRILALVGRGTKEVTSTGVIETSSSELGTISGTSYEKLADIDVPSDFIISNLTLAHDKIFAIGTEPRSNNAKLLVFNLQGQKESEQEAEMGTKFISDGKTLYRIDGGLGVINIGKVNPETLKVDKPKGFEGMRGISSIDEDKLYFVDSTSFYEYDFNTDETRLLFRLASVGITSGITSIAADGKGGFIAGDTFAIRHIMKTEGKARQQIMLAVNDARTGQDPYYAEFNENSDKYEVIIKDYSGYPDPQQMLSLDITAGDVPDAIALNGFSGDAIKESTMEDLLPYLKNDPDIDMSDIREGFLNAMLTKDGKLLWVANAYAVVSAFCRRGEIEPFEFSSAADSLQRLGDPEEAFAKTLPRNEFLSLAFNYGDSDKFSREDIKAIIEYAEKLPEQPEYSDAQKAKFNIGTVSSDTGMLIVAIYSFDNPDLEELQVLGPLFRPGTGAYSPLGKFAIPINAKNKEGAWELIKPKIPSEIPFDFQGLSILKSYDYARVKKLAEFLQSKGRKPYIPYTKDGLESEYYYEETDYLERLEQLIAGAKGCYAGNNAAYNNPTMVDKMFNTAPLNIVLDACAAYFAGQKTSDATADEILNRLATYFAEQG